ncbi:cytochrome c3 family protein [Tropicibacter sp. R15_0]|uniref:cytochrome c3 family protein n=1 Tax=Tropicibacter sp. R15_0 TaxID=2821101 RepID=UPI001ADBA946|nr:cytochrome c3 family protein [Tropicibacter sp. R15_0]MBO9463696.1 cytochrome c3 family protein [Tropicibacter sp. R15_0]
MSRTVLLWGLWALLTALGASAVFAALYINGDRSALLPGQTAGAHHQLEIACETCHTAKPFASQAKVKKKLNKTCVTCHKDELKAGDDSHPKKKFTNPRMAAYWEEVDGRFCTTCHAEHVPEQTQPMMVTLQGDFCVSCHSKGDQDVRKNRESHAGLSFDTCASAGCHNYHDNRALYEDFLVKHSGKDWLAAHPVVEAAALPTAAKPADQQEIETYLAAIEAPAEDETINHDWAGSAHAVADVTCNSCHAAEDTAWTDHPDQDVCADCHKGAAKSFSLGRHGMRGHSKISKPRDVEKRLKKLGLPDAPEFLVSAIETYLADPSQPEVMTVQEARVDLKAEAHGEGMTCNSCHLPHREEPDHSAVTACLTCHNDDHSLSYLDSPHHNLWQAEQTGNAVPGSGVTCATCHMPQSEKKGLAVTNHNQNDNLRPNEKMIRSVCLTCHSLEFAIDALADPALVSRNFTGQPTRHIESIDWALKRVEPSEQGANQ